MERYRRTLREVLAGRPRRVVAVAREATVADALQVMADADVGAVLVLDGNRLVGVLSERDYARRGELRGRTAQHTPVHELMTPTVITASPDRTVEQCMAEMTDSRVRHLPIVDGDDILGVVSIGDLVKIMSSHYRDVVRDVEHDKLFMRFEAAGYY